MHVIFNRREAAPHLISYILYLITFKATPHNSARNLSERFCASSKFRKRGNTVCISRFWNCRTGAKDPLRSADVIVRCCPNIQIGNLSRQKPLPMGEVSALGAEVEGPLSHGLSRDSSPIGGAKASNNIVIPNQCAHWCGNLHRIPISPSSYSLSFFVQFPGIHP